MRNVMKKIVLVSLLATAANMLPSMSFAADLEQLRAASVVISPDMAANVTMPQIPNVTLQRALAEDRVAGLDAAQRALAANEILLNREGFETLRLDPARPVRAYWFAEKGSRANWFIAQRGDFGFDGNGVRAISGSLAARLAALDELRARFDLYDDQLNPVTWGNVSPTRVYYLVRHGATIPADYAARRIDPIVAGGAPFEVPRWDFDANPQEYTQLNDAAVLAAIHRLVERRAELQQQMPMDGRPLMYVNEATGAPQYFVATQLQRRLADLPWTAEELNREGLAQRLAAVYAFQRVDNGAAIPFEALRTLPPTTPVKLVRQ